jgi:hypothetical protein
MTQKNKNLLYVQCLNYASELMKYFREANIDIADDVNQKTIAKLLFKLEIERYEKNKISDLNIDYNDEIVSIECVGCKETIDIAVSDDNLFYCSNILTKNSFGVPATADLMFAIINTEQLENTNQVLIKQLKNRYNDIVKNKRFLLGVDRSKMRLYDLEEIAQKGIASNLENLDNEDDDNSSATISSKDQKRTTTLNTEGFIL